MSRFELAVFDWNGTLTRMDAEKKLSYGAVEEIFRTYGLTAPPADEYFSVITSDYMNGFYWPRGIPQTATRADLNAIRTRFILNRWDAQALLKPEMKEAVWYCGRVHKMMTAIVSGEYCPLLIKGTHLAGILPDLNYVRADATPKDVELENACKALDVPPNRAFYLDDSFEGIQAAKKAGLYAIAITDGYAPRKRLLEAGPDAIVSDLRAFMEHISKAA